MIDGYYVSVIDVEKLLCSKLGIKWSATDISMSVDSLADRLLAATPATPTAPAVFPAIRYDVLHEYADEHRLDFNALCSTVREAVFQGIVASSPAPAPAASITQCDGCQRGLPVNDWGHHRDESGAMGCTADRYAAPVPAASDAPVDFHMVVVDARLLLDCQQCIEKSHEFPLPQRGR
jgi:hypothetical protein